MSLIYLVWETRRLSEGRQELGLNNDNYHETLRVTSRLFYGDFLVNLMSASIT
jgi:hypothetical protein